MGIRIFPFPARLNQKWWHRLSKVLILIISGIACLIGILLTWAVIDESRVRHDIYNFEPGYSSNTHSAGALNHWNASYDFVDRFIAASNNQVSSDREIFLNPVSLYNLESIFNANNDYQVQDAFLKYIESGKSDKEYRIKIWYEYSWFPGILFLLTGPVVHLLLIGIYGVVLYIAFGTNPFLLNSFKEKEAARSNKSPEADHDESSSFKKFGAFILAFLVFGLVAQIGSFFENWAKLNFTDSSSPIFDLVAIVQIASFIGGLIAAQRVYRSMVPSQKKYSSFKLGK